MAQTLVIEWDRDRLLAASGATSGSSVKIAAAATIDRSGNLLAAEIGERLAEGLKSAGITAEEATVVFPRDLVSFHRVTLPNLGDDMIPDMVRMQASTRLTVPVESVCLDFVPLPIAPGAETREVLLVTLPQQYVSQVREALAVCSITLSSVRISSFGIAASVVHAGLLSKQSGSNSVEAIVSLGSDSIETIFMDGNSVAFSHSGASWSSLDGVEQAVRAEVSRARMAAAEDMGSYTVSRVTLIGSDEVTSAVPDTISKRLNDAEVVRVDPDGKLLTGLFNGISASDMLAIAGAIANTTAGSVQNVDLVNPRKAPEKKDYGRLKKILIGGTIALVVIGGWKWRDGKVSGYESQTAKLQGDILDMRDRFKMSKNDLALADNLKAWQERDLSWLDEMKKLRELMGSTERVFIKELKFKQSGASKDYVATVEADGLAKSRRDIEDLERTLRKAGYEVKPNTITQSFTDEDYSMAVKLDVRILAPKEPKSATKA